MIKNSLFLKSLLAASLVILVGCTGLVPKQSLVGKPSSEVIAALGKPDHIRTLSTGTRLEYIEGPTGRETHFFWVGPEDRVVRWEQVLVEKNFEKITPGMTTEDVVLLIGPSRNVQSLARGRGFFWSYRYMTPFCRWFQVEFTTQGAVRSAGYGFPPECLRSDRWF